MGIPGLTRWLEGHDCTHLVRSAEEGTDYLCFDMNGVCHAAYNSAHNTPEQTISAIIALVLKCLDFFSPSKGVAIVFDGPAPISKLAEQRKRRQNVPLPNAKRQQQELLGDGGQGKKGKKASKGKKGNEHVDPTDTTELSKKKAPPPASPLHLNFNSNYLTTGSPFMLQLEESVVNAVKRFVAKKLNNRLHHIFVSGTLVPGEGEVKIVNYWKNVLATGAGGGLYNPADRIVTVSTDSDLALYAIASTDYSDYHVVHPHNFLSTSIEGILTRWTRGGSARWAFTPTQLASVRRDFVFLMCLSGGDHYPGVESSSFDYWHKYRKLRHTNHQQAPLVGDDLSINLELLRTLVCEDKAGIYRKPKDKKGRSSGSAPVEPGHELMKGALWAFATVMRGECPNYRYVFRGDNPKPSNLRAALRQSSQRTTQYQNVVDTDPLFPMEVFVSVVPHPVQLPTAVQQVLENSDEAKPLYRRLQNTTSSRYIADTVRQIMSSIPAEAWTEEDKVLLAFRESTLLPLEGAVPTEPEPDTDTPKEPTSLDGATAVNGNGDVPTAVVKTLCTES